jgi:hypothetical protein
MGFTKLEISLQLQLALEFCLSAYQASGRGFAWLSQARTTFLEVERECEDDIDWLGNHMKVVELGGFYSLVGLYCGDGVLYL